MLNESIPFIAWEDVLWIMNDEEEYALEAWFSLFKSQHERLPREPVIWFRLLNLCFPEPPDIWNDLIMETEKSAGILPSGTRAIIDRRVLPSWDENPLHSTPLTIDIAFREDAYGENPGKLYYNFLEAPDLLTAEEYVHVYNEPCVIRKQKESPLPRIQIERKES